MCTSGNNVTRIENVGVSATGWTVFMTCSELFKKQITWETWLVTNDLDGALDHAANDMFCPFFPASYISLLRFNAHHFTCDTVREFSVVVIIYGYKYGCGEMLQCTENFYREGRMLQRAFIGPVLLVGKVFGWNIFKNGTYKILADALYRTYEYIDQRATVSLTVCIALNPSRAGASTASSSWTAR